MDMKNMMEMFSSAMKNEKMQTNLSSMMEKINKSDDNISEESKDILAEFDVIYKKIYGLEEKELLKLCKFYQNKSKKDTESCMLDMEKMSKLYKSENFINNTVIS